jgi:hypothetical protein
VRPYIRFAAKFLGPLHESVAFAELIDHRFLSPDFLVQSSRFSSAVELTVNLGPTPRTFEGDLTLPAYGFRIVKADGSVSAGRFRHHAEIGDNDIDF